MSDTAEFLLPLAVLAVVFVVGLFQFRARGMAWSRILVGGFGGLAIGVVVLGGLLWASGMIVL